MRTTDNRFYWLTSNGIHPSRVNGLPWNNRVLPARLYGRIDPATNQINVGVDGIQQVSVWLSRDARIDFDKPVLLRVNTAQWGPARRVHPSPTVLLEDYYDRGDRKSLYIARIDLNNLR